jgi:hypothetical protein
MSLKERSPIPCDADKDGPIETVSPAESSCNNIIKIEKTKQW